LTPVLFGDEPSPLQFSACIAYTYTVATGVDRRKEKNQKKSTNRVVGAQGEVYEKMFDHCFAVIREEDPSNVRAKYSQTLFCI